MLITVGGLKGKIMAHIPWQLAPFNLMMYWIAVFREWWLVCYTFFQDIVFCTC